MNNYAITTLQNRLKEVNVKLASLGQVHSRDRVILIQVREDLLNGLKDTLKGIELRKVDVDKTTIDFMDWCKE